MIITMSFLAYEMYYKLLSICLFIALIFANCVDNESVPIKLIQSTSTFSLNITDIDNTLKWKLSNSSSGRQFSFYNFHSNEIQFYNLDQEKIEKAVKIQNEGPNKASVNEYLILDSSVYCFDAPWIRELNYKGELLHTMELKHPIEDKFLYEASSVFFDGIADHSTQKIYPLMSHDGDGLKDEIEIATVNVIDKSIDYYSIPGLPDYYEKLESLRSHWMVYSMFAPYITLIKDEIFLSFPLNGDIYIYNNDQWIRKDLNSKFYSKNNHVLIFADVNKKSIGPMIYGNPHFGPLYYDEFREMYVRISWLPKENDKRKAVMSLYDCELNLLHEFVLDKTIDPRRLAILEDGIYLKEFALSENELRFRVFSVESD